MEYKKLNGKVAFTSGTTGIGLATAKLFLQNGAKVVVASRNHKHGEMAINDLKTISPETHFVSADISSIKRPKIWLKRWWIFTVG